MEIIVVTDVMILFGFAFEVSRSIEVLAALLTDAIVGGALIIAAEVNDSGWTAVLTALERTSPAPPQESLLAW